LHGIGGIVHSRHQPRIFGGAGSQYRLHVELAWNRAVGTNRQSA
jgi:hypothetical protein